MLKPGPVSGPDAKYVKFSTIHKLLEDEFPSDYISKVESAKIIQMHFHLVRAYEGRVGIGSLEYN